MKRYIIHADGRATWLLVSRKESGRSHIERLGPQGERAWFDFRNFERSEIGKQLAPKLKGALMEAQLDS